MSVRTACPIEAPLRPPGCSRGLASKSDALPLVELSALTDDRSRIARDIATGRVKPHPAVRWTCGPQDHTSPQLFESISTVIPGTSRIEFTAPRLPPLTSLARIMADVQSMRDQGGKPDEYEEAAIRLTGCAVAALSESAHSRRSPAARDERRVAQTLRWIEAHGNAPASIDTLAAEVAISTFHVLRIFDQVVGVTPGQYLLRRRVHQAATRLRGSGETIVAVALESGFDDFSSFNRQFRRAFGLTPSSYRAQRAATLCMALNSSDASVTAPAAPRAWRRRKRPAGPRPPTPTSSRDGGN